MTISRLFKALVAIAAISGVHLHSTKDDNYKTVLLILVSRHGARTPNNNLITLPWAAGMEKSQLTEQGKIQHYMLGQILRHEYKDLLGNESMK